MTRRVICRFFGHKAIWLDIGCWYCERCGQITDALGGRR